MRRADKQHSVCVFGSDTTPNPTTNPTPDPNPKQVCFFGSDTTPNPTTKPTPDPSPKQVCFFGSDTNGLRRRALHALRNVPGAVLRLEP